MIECGEMVLAGVAHPDYDRELTEEDHAVIQGRACFIGNHGATCDRQTIDNLRWLDTLGEAVERGLVPVPTSLPGISFLRAENIAVEAGLACWVWSMPKRDPPPQGRRRIGPGSPAGSGPYRRPSEPKV